MKKIVFGAVLVVLMMAGSALAQEKCNAIPWGEPFATVEELEFSHVVDGTRYYRVKKVKACGISQLEDTRVTYGFRENRLYTTIVEIEKATDVKRVISMLMADYGLPDHKKVDGWDIYKWETDDLKVKLKSLYSSDRIKIGMYYKPLMPKK